MMSEFDAYQRRLLFAIKTTTKFGSFCSPEWATRRNSQERNSRDVERTSHAFLFHDPSSLNKWLHCFYQRPSHAKRDLMHCFFSSVLRKNSFHALFLSCCIMAATRNTFSTSNNIVKHLAADINVSSAYSARRIHEANYTPRFRTTLPQCTRRRGVFFQSGSNSVASLAHSLQSSEKTFKVTLSCRASTEEFTFILLLLQTDEGISSTTNNKPRLLFKCTDFWPSATEYFPTKLLCRLLQLPTSIHSNSFSVLLLSSNETPWPSSPTAGLKKK